MSVQEIHAVDALLSFVAENHSSWGILVLFFSSLIEYVFPPFPGDVITLFGTWLVLREYWSFSFALFIVTSGSLVGATLDYQLGVVLGRKLERLPSEKTTKRWTPLTKEKYELLSQKFSKHGVVYIVVNRFLPGIRAFFFVVAGAVRMPLWKVLFYAAISALAWNTLILVAGLAVGANWEAMRSFFTSYTIVVWCGLGIAIALMLSFWWIRKRNSLRKTDPSSAHGGAEHGKE